MIQVNHCGEFSAIHLMKLLHPIIPDSLLLAAGSDDVLRALS